MVVLDATAGNRNMWKQVDFNPPHTVFIDVETKLYRPPTIFADNRCSPFRDDVFDCVFYDPPFVWSIAPWFMNASKKDKLARGAPFYGDAKSKRQMLVDIHKAQKEFQRLTNRLCFKWGELRLSLWKILPFFKDWKIKQIKEQKNPHHTSRLKGKSKWKTYWVTFVHSSR